MFSSREGVRALGPLSFAGCTQVRSRLGVPCSVQLHPYLHQDLLPFRRAGLQENTDPMGSQTAVPHTQRCHPPLLQPNPTEPQRAQLKQPGGSTKTPYRLVSKKHTLRSLWLVAAFRFLEDKPPIPLLCPPSFNHTAFLCLLGQASSLGMH